MELFEAVEGAVRQVVASEVQKLVNERLTQLVRRTVEDTFDSAMEAKVVNMLDARFTNIGNTIRYEVEKEMAKMLREPATLQDHIKVGIATHCGPGGYILTTVQEEVQRNRDVLIRAGIEAECEADGMISACIEQHLSAAQDSFLESDELEEYVKDTCHDILDDKLEDKLTSGYVLERAVKEVLENEVSIKVVIE